MTCLHNSQQYKEEIPLDLLNVNLIVKGDEGLIWTLISKLKEICPKLHSRERIIYLEEIELPYSFDEIERLEQSLLNWLLAMKVLQKTDYVPRYLSDIDHLVKNGTLLCELVQKMLRVKLHAVVWDPKTESTCIQNIRKALDRLK